MLPITNQDIQLLLQLTHSIFASFLLTPQVWLQIKKVTQSMSGLCLLLFVQFLDHNINSAFNFILVCFPDDIGDYIFQDGVVYRIPLDLRKITD